MKRIRSALIILMIFSGIGYAQTGSGTSAGSSVGPPRQHEEQRLLKTCRMFPDSTTALLSLLEHYLSEGRPHRIISLFACKDSVSELPGSCHLLLGKAYEQQGMGPEAIAAYRRAMAGSEAMPALLRLCMIHFKQQQYAETAECCRHYLETDSGNVFIHYLLGRAHIKTGEYEKAAAVAEKALRLDPESFPNMLNYGMSHYYLKRIGSAATVLNTASALSPGNDECLYFLGRCHMILNDAAAIEVFERCAAQNAAYKIRAIRTLIMLYYQEGKLEDCISKAGEYLALGETEGLETVYYFFARACSDLTRYKEAAACFQESLHYSNSGFIEGIYLYTGLNYYLSGDYPRAIKHYRTALVLNPASASALFNLAIAYDDYYKDPNPALTTYERLISAAGGNPACEEMCAMAKSRIKELRELIFFNRR